MKTYFNLYQFNCNWTFPSLSKFLLFGCLFLLCSVQVLGNGYEIKKIKVYDENNDLIDYTDNGKFEVECDDEFEIKIVAWIKINKNVKEKIKIPVEIISNYSAPDDNSNEVIKRTISKGNFEYEPDGVTFIYWDTITLTVSCIEYEECKCKLEGSYDDLGDEESQSERVLDVKVGGKTYGEPFRVICVKGSNDQASNVVPEKEFYLPGEAGKAYLELANEQPNVSFAFWQIAYDPSVFGIENVVFTPEIQDQYPFADAFWADGFLNILLEGSAPGNLPEIIAEINFFVLDNAQPGFPTFNITPETGIYNLDFEKIMAVLGDNVIPVYPPDNESPVIDQSLVEITEEGVFGLPGAVTDDNLGFAEAFKNLQVSLYSSDSTRVGTGFINNDGSFEIDSLNLFEGSQLMLKVEDHAGHLAAALLLVQALEMTYTVLALKQISFEQPFNLPNSPKLQFLFNYFMDNTVQPHFLNLLFRSPVDGSLKWGFQNMPLVPFPDTSTITVEFPIANLTEWDGQAIEELELVTLISEEEMVGIPDLQYLETHQVGKAAYRIPYNPTNTVDWMQLFPQNITFLVQEFIDWYFPYTDSICIEMRGCTMPNIDLDGSTNDPDDPNQPYPGYAGDENACAPAAVANSFSWLRAQHPEIDDALEDEFGDDEDSHRELLVEVSKLMKRSNKTGVFPDSIIRGKLALIDEYQIPAHVKFQSIFGYGDLPSFNPTYGHEADDQSEAEDAEQPNAHISLDWIARELKADEDVELHIDCYQVDSTGNPVVGADGFWINTMSHVVTLTDIFNFRGNWSLGFKDDFDQTQEDEEGLRHEFGRVIPEPAGANEFLRGMLYLPNLSIPGFDRCYITSVYSESYDEDVTFVPVATHSKTAPGFEVQVLGNPVKEGQDIQLSIELKQSSPIRISLISASGKVLNTALVENQPVGKQSYSLSAQNVSNGIFFLEIQTETGRKVEKIIIVR